MTYAGLNPSRSLEDDPALHWLRSGGKLLLPVKMDMDWHLELLPRAAGQEGLHERVVLSHLSQSRVEGPGLLGEIRQAEQSHGLHHGDAAVKAARESRLQRPGMD